MIGDMIDIFRATRSAVNQELSRQGHIITSSSNTFVFDHTRFSTVLFYGTILSCQMLEISQF